MIDNKNLLYRVMTAVVAIVGLLFILKYGSWPFYLTILGLSMIAFFEFSRMADNLGKKPFFILAHLVGIVLLVGQAYDIPIGFGKLLSFIIIAMGIQSVIEYPKRDFENLSLSIFGTIYTYGLFSYMILMRDTLDNGFFWLLFVLALIWTGDTAAYFVGSNLGRKPLCPSLSPKKSVEGAIGALVGILLVAVLTGIYTAYYNIWQGIGLGLLVTVAGIFGDLFESSLKRKAGVKDSGTILPGHGGILDRFDSALFVIPIAYYYILYVIF